MPMLSDDEILKKAMTGFNEFMQSKQWWRQNEVNENYAMDAGDQWSIEDYNRYKADGIPMITVNKISPVVDSVVGFEIQNRSEVKYTARITTKDNQENQKKAEAFSQTIESGVNFIENTAKVAFHNSMAFRDMTVCGIGATNSIIEYSKDDSGMTNTRRIFPGFLLYDAAAREKNLADRNWCAEARIVDQRAFEEEYSDIKSKGVGFSFDDTQFLQYFDALQSQVPITIVYEFQWRCKEDRIRVPNPFYDHMDDAAVMNTVMEAEKAYKFNLDDGVLGFDAPDFNKFKKYCEFVGVHLAKPLKQKVYRYYRALIGGGVVLKKELNYSQEDYSIQIMTGKFDEGRQCFYGMIRAMKDPQRMHNRSISDLQGFLNTSAKGGAIIESDAVDDLPAFIRTWAKARHVTVVKPGKLSGGAVQQKQSPQLPAGMPDMIALSDQSIPASAGVNPEWMGQMQSMDMTAALQTKIVRQGLAILAPYFDAKKYYTISQGRIFVDCLKILAENNPGRLVPMKDKDEYLELFADNIAVDYDVTILDVPMTDDRKNEIFDKMMELAGAMAQSGVNIMPLAIKYAPLEPDDRDEIEQMMQPSPPPPPDPVQTALLQSTTALNMANAKKITADATKINMDMLKDRQQLQKDLDQLTADVEKTLSETALNKAKTLATLSPPATP